MKKKTTKKKSKKNDLQSRSFQTEDKVTEKWLCFFAKKKETWYNIGKEARDKNADE